VNPWPVVIADLRALRWVAWMAPLLVAIAVAVGIAISAQETALRRSSAQAADDFDLLIGAPGSHTQLMLTTVFLQPEAIPLIDGAILNALARDERINAAAPIAFGDSVRGHPVIGTTAAFAGRWGRLAPTEGRLFARDGEAVVGADVALHLGEAITPSHGVAAGRRNPSGSESEDEARHRHEGVRYTVVGRLPRLGTPWDNAILVPIESVWETHGLGNGHTADDAALGPPFDAGKVPGVPAIVVKPRAVADAYALRSQYRQGGTVAFFPAEVLVGLYATLGDVRDVLVVATALNDVLIFTATVMLLLALAGLRRRRYAVLRALGASRSYILLAVWLGAALLLAAGCLCGLVLGGLAAWLLGHVVEQRTGLVLSSGLGLPEVLGVLGLIVAGSLLALLPAIASFRTPVDQSLR
jgi:putative ABC transport system permease protein